VAEADSLGTGGTKPVMPAEPPEPFWFDIIRLVAVFALVLLNGFFVAAELSLVAVRRTQVEQMVRQGLRGSGSLMRHLQSLDRSIAANQLGITLASLRSGWLGEP